jgi:hypothetical protein
MLQRREATRGGDTLKFNVKKNIWNEETSINLRETVLKAVPLEIRIQCCFLSKKTPTLRRHLSCLKAGQGKTMQAGIRLDKSSKKPSVLWAVKRLSTLQVGNRHEE